MEKKMLNNLKAGFTLFRWGLDLCFGALIVVATGLVKTLVLNKGSILSVCLTGFSFVVTGFIILFIGRMIVGLETRKLNFMTGRKRTEVEDWLVNIMLGIEEEAGKENLYNQISKISSNKIDDSITAVSGASTISRFTQIGKVFMSGNTLLNRGALIISTIFAAVLLLI